MRRETFTETYGTTIIQFIKKKMIKLLPDVKKSRKTFNPLKGRPDNAEACILRLYRAEKKKPSDPFGCRIRKLAG